MQPREDMHTFAAAMMVGALVAAGSVDVSARTNDRRALPAPQRDGGPSLTHVLATRHSVRTFRSDAIDDEALGQLLWAAQGINDGHRTAPSAGALYPLTIYVADAQGVWRYVPADHALVRERTDDRRAVIARACFGQDAVSGAPVVLVVTAEVAITARKYGSRADRFAALEAGHATQNVLLTATALGLGAVPIGAFEDAAIAKAVGFPADQTPFYVVPIGTPR
jgi:SagB-type dehydrogenase family enzyme